MATPLPAADPTETQAHPDKDSLWLVPHPTQNQSPYLTSAHSSGKPLSYEKVKVIVCHSFLSLDTSPLTERYTRSVEMPQGTCIKSIHTYT